MASKKSFKVMAVSLIGAFSLNTVSCVNTYDSAGRPRQTVDPAVAVAGVAAAGLVGYAVAKDRKNDRKKDRRRHYQQPRNDYDSYERYEYYDDSYDYGYGY